MRLETTRKWVGSLVTVVATRVRYSAWITCLQSRTKGSRLMTRVATTVTKLPTHFRVVSNLIHQLNHAPGISPVEEATLHGHGKRVSHLNGIHAHVVAEAVHLCDGLYVPVVTVSAQRPYTLVFDPGRYVIPILIVIDVGAVDHTTGHAAVFPLSSPILAVLMQRLAADG